MSRIETCCWKSDPTDPDKMLYDGQRTAYEVFTELKEHLDAMGYLPDEYFLLDMELRDGALFPKGAWLTQSVDFGGNEGIYLDISLNWVDANRKTITKGFATGKTLGETGEDLNRMHLTAAAVNMAFHYDGVHARYIQVGPTRKPNGITIHLSGDEQENLAIALLIARTEQKITGQQYGATEKLLRRLTGNITEYMQMVGERPLDMDNLDLAALAIRECNLIAFNEAFPNIKDNYGELLALAAGQPGHVGYVMTEHILSHTHDIPAEQYMKAGKNAVKTGDMMKVRLMLDHAAACMAENTESFYTEVVTYAYKYLSEDFCGIPMAKELVYKADAEQVAALPASLVVYSLEHEDEDFAHKLLISGVGVGNLGARVLYAASNMRHTWLARELAGGRFGIDISRHGTEALWLCMDRDNWRAAKVLAENGADILAFVAQYRSKRLNDSATNFIQQLEHYYEEQTGIHLPVQESDTETSKIP